MIWNRILEMLFPPRCVLCRSILEKEETDLCHKCRADAPKFSKASRKIRFIKAYTAVWHYEGNVRRSLIRYKFRNARSYCGCYSRMAAMRVSQDLPEDIDLITWVPIGPKRKRSRGYDQVELIAEGMKKELELPAQKLLVKKRDNKPQSGINSAEKRRANVLGVYEIQNEEKIAGRNILLLDDIITTGSTVSECARMLTGAGAKNVYCAAVAAGRNQK